MKKKSEVTFSLSNQLRYINLKKSTNSANLSFSLKSLQFHTQYSSLIAQKLIRRKNYKYLIKFKVKRSRYTHANPNFKSIEYTILSKNRYTLSS